MVEVKDEPGHRKVAVFHGNCQAGALVALFEQVPQFTAAYQIVVIPQVHEITPEDLPTVDATFARADLVITQAVREDYRGLPIGTEQVLARAAGAEVVRIPALYSDATVPFQGYIRDGDGLPVDAPITVYHDLRALALAAAGGGPADVPALLSEHVPPADALRHNAEIGDERLRALERESDIRVLDTIFDPAFRGGAFWAVNHPSAAVMDLFVTTIQEALGMTPQPSGLRADLLDRYKTPIERPTVRALGLETFGSDVWIVDGREHSLASVLEANTAMLAGRPDLITTGLEDHGARLEAFGLAPDDVRGAGWIGRRSATVAVPAHGWITPDEGGASARPDAYLPIYEELLADLRDRPIALLELGVGDAPSLQMWHRALPNAVVVGVAPGAEPADLAPGVTLARAAQDDATALAALRRTHAPDGFDVIVDDASHLGAVTARSLQALYRDHLRPGGLYVIEDWGAGYLETFADGAAPDRLSVASLDYSNPAGRLPSHDAGAVGLVKRLVDHVAAGTISSLHPEVFEDALPIRSLTVRDGLVALRKPH